jgi:hypothetical protein
MAAVMSSDLCWDLHHGPPPADVREYSGCPGLSPLAAGPVNLRFDHAYLGCPWQEGSGETLAAAPAATEAQSRTELAIDHE